MKFDSECCKLDSDVGEEESGVAINNLLVIISYLYAWRIVQCALVFDILNKLAERFRSKDIQLIILCLTNCGMSLRKDDPTALKNFIQRVQSTASKRKAEDSRVQFMLEVLTGIKNNNVNKIPNYDPSHFEHLKKNFKICLREGKFVTELNISYKDLIQVRRVTNDHHNFIHMMHVNFRLNPRADGGLLDLHLLETSWAPREKTTDLRPRGRWGSSSATSCSTWQGRCG